MHSLILQRVRRLVAGAGVCVCLCAGNMMAQGSGAGQGKTPEAGAAPVSTVAPGSTLVLQAELPERKFPVLAEILKRGLAEGPNILMREWDAAAAAQDALGQGRAPMLPSLSFGGDFGPTYEQHQGDGVSNRTMLAALYNLRLYQPIYQWGALTNNNQIWQLRKAMSERNITETRRQLAIDIRQGYFEMILAANSLRLARNNFEKLERNHKEMEQAIADGSSAPGDLDTPNRDIQNAKPALARLENNLATCKQGLVQITGLPASVIDQVPVEIPALADLHEALGALANSITLPPSANLENLTDNARIEKLNYAINKKRLYPRLGLVLAVSQENRTPDGGSQGQRYIITTWGAYAEVGWTLFDGFAAKSAQRASLNRIHSSEAARDQVEKKESIDRQMEVANLQVQWEELQNTERDLARTRGGSEVAEQDFKNGMISARQVEDARLYLDNALQSVFRVRASFYLALARCLSNRGQDPALRAAE